MNIDSIGVRELARAAGIAPSTASRVKQGQTDKLDMVTAKAVLPFLSECPCCGGATPSISPLAAALALPEVQARLKEAWDLGYEHGKVLVCDDPKKCRDLECDMLTAIKDASHD